MSMATRNDIPKATGKSRSTKLGARVSMVYILARPQKKGAQAFCFVLKRFLNRRRPLRFCVYYSATDENDWLLASRNPDNL
jgi:hypothetical protein